MIINLTYIFFILIGIYFGIYTYIVTRKRQTMAILAIFVFSLVLECMRLNSESYALDVNDFLRTTRDIIRTLIMIMFFQCMRHVFPRVPDHECSACRPFKRHKKQSK